MSTYPQRVADNILPLSLAGTLPEAFEEWYFTGRTEDHEQAVEECELCDQEQLRYHFEIENRHTLKRLWIGSQCILRFKVAVYEQGWLLDEKQTKKKLDGLIRKMRLDSCLKALRNLALVESHEVLNSALDYYQRNKCLTPRHASVVLWRLKKNKIDHLPSFFKISLRKQRHKAQLAELDSFRIHTIWPALTSSQRKIAMDYGHKPPSDSGGRP